MVVKRDIIEEIKIFLKRREFIAIIGPRQAGKTTLLEMLKDYLVSDLKVDKRRIQTVTFEDRRLLAQFESEPIGFVQSYFPILTEDEPSYLMIDEFQYVENGGQKLKLLYDTMKGIKIIITGSSSLEIKAEVGRFMVGRLLSFYLFPFNFSEILRAKDLRLEGIYQKNNKLITEWLFEAKEMDKREGKDIFREEVLRYYEDYCIFGGYPSVVLSLTEKEKRKVLSEIYNNYILKEIKTLLELSTEKNLLFISQYLATQIGNLLTYQDLCQASGLNYRQVKKHLHILKETMVCLETKPFFTNRKKELTKNPKVFFIDLGFRNNLIENMNRFDKRSDKGALVENAVFGRLNELTRDCGKINFWRTKAKAEVDFILQIKGETIPLEVKFSRFSFPKLSRSLISFINSYKPKQGLILTQDYWGITQVDKTKILFAPVYYL
ncbi:MAG: ATP-binding protein [bacterium]